MRIIKLIDNSKANIFILKAPKHLHLDFMGTLKVKCAIFMLKYTLIAQIDMQTL